MPAAESGRRWYPAAIVGLFVAGLAGVALQGIQDGDVEAVQGHTGGRGHDRAGLVVTTTGFP